jgi:hypothetical protein
MVFTPPKDLYTKEHYDKVLAHLGAAFPPPTMTMHVMGMTDEGEVRIVDIFESAAEFQRFAESHAPVYEKMGISVDDVLKHASVFQIEKTIKK